MTTAADLKQQLAELADRRSHLEQDVSLARARLEAAGLGMDEPLVDNEGFPKPDIDIAAIRSDRQKVRSTSLSFLPRETSSWAAAAAAAVFGREILWARTFN